MGWQVGYLAIFILGAAAIPSLVTSTDGADLLFKSNPNQKSQRAQHVPVETFWNALRSEHSKSRFVRRAPQYPGCVITIDDAQATSLTGFLKGFLETFTQKPQPVTTPGEYKNEIRYTCDSGVSNVKTSVWLILNRVWLATSCQYPDEEAFKDALREVNTEKERISRILTNVDVKTPEGFILFGTYVATVKEVKDTLEAAVDTMTRVYTSRQCNSVKQVTDTLEVAVQEIIAVRKTVAQQAEANSRQVERLGKLEEDLRAFLADPASKDRRKKPENNKRPGESGRSNEGSAETFGNQTSSEVSETAPSANNSNSDKARQNSSSEMERCGSFEEKQEIPGLIVTAWVKDIQNGATDDLISVATDPETSYTVSDNLCTLINAAYDNDTGNTGAVLDFIGRLTPNISSAAVAIVLPILPTLMPSWPSLIRSGNATGISRLANDAETSDWVKKRINALVRDALLDNTENADAVLNFITTLPSTFIKGACQPVIRMKLPLRPEHIQTGRTACILELAYDPVQYVLVKSRLRSLVSEAYENNPNNTNPILDFIAKLPSNLAKTAYNHIFPVLLPSLLTSIRTKDISHLISFASDPNSSYLAFDVIQTLVVQAYDNSNANFEAVSAFTDQLPNRFVKPACEILPSSTVSMWSKHVRSGDTACVWYTVNAVNSTVTANEIQSLIKDAYVNDVGNKDAVLRFIEKLPSNLAVAALEIISSNLLVTIENGGNTTDIVRLAANPSTYPFLLSRIRSLVSDTTNDTDAVLDFIEALPDERLAIQAYETLLSDITPKKDPIRTLYQLCERSKKYNGSGDGGRPFSRQFVNTKVHPGFLKLLAGEFFNLEGYAHRGGYFYLYHGNRYGEVANFFANGRGLTTDSETKKQDKWLWQFVPVPGEDGKEFYIRNKVNKEKPFTGRAGDGKYNYFKLEPATPIVLPTGGMNNAEIIIFMRHSYQDNVSYKYWLADNLVEGGRQPRMSVYTTIGGQLNREKWIPTFRS